MVVTDVPQVVVGPPALVVEILSRGTRKRDEPIKRRLFERTGVREGSITASKWS